MNIYIVILAVSVSAITSVAVTKLWDVIEILIRYMAVRRNENKQKVRK